MTMHPLTVVEPASYAILALAAFAAHRRGRLRAFLGEGALVALGGLLGEWTILRWYGFYAYAPEWSLFVDVMPLTVALIWGYVLVSARELAGCFVPRRPAWLVGAIVLFDAALIEPVASRAGLWTWDDGGLWAVPWIGWLGWGFYAMAASWLLDRPRWKLLTPLLAPAVTHLLLLATWWGALRWFARTPAPEAVLVALSILTAAGLARAATRVPPPPPGLVLPRAPAGLLFFALLPFAEPTPAFLAFVLPFALPWAVVTARAALASRPGGAREGIADLP